MKIVKHFICSFSLLSIISSQVLADLSLFRMGAHVSTVSSPYPAFLGLGPALNIIDFVQLDAGFAPFEFSVANRLGLKHVIWGMSARVRIPVPLFLSPTAGIGYSQEHISAEKSDFYGRRKDVSRYITPFVGFTLNLGSMAYISFGLQYVTKKIGSTYEKYDTSTDGMFAGTGFLPFGQISIFPF